MRPSHGEGGGVTGGVTLRRQAAILAATLALACASARGDTVSSQSSASLTSEYYSNPYVLPSQTRSAEAADPANEPGDQLSCDYWRYCGFDGNLCGCCGGSVTECPAGSIMSPTGWVGTCRHPVDGKDYIIAYRDCCGKEYCGRCACHGDKGDLPIYRTQLDNEVLWCFGVKSGWAVNCTTAVNLGVKS